MPVVRIPTPLRPHADGLDSVDAPGSTVGEVLGQVFEQASGPERAPVSTALTCAGSSTST